jgi:membrane-associated phospholipid phosphatase
VTPAWRGARHWSDAAIALLIAWSVPLRAQDCAARDPVPPHALPTLSCGPDAAMCAFTPVAEDVATRAFSLRTPCATARDFAPSAHANYRAQLSPAATQLPQFVGARLLSVREPPLFSGGLRRADLWKTAWFAATATAMIPFDRRVDAWTRRASVQDNTTLRSLSNVGDALGYVALGAGPATWVLGRARGDSGTAMLGFRTTEAVVLSGAVISAIKVVAGRTRPFASADNSPAHWKLFGGFRSDSTRSFASGHSALTAAAAVTLAAEWRRQGLRGWKTAGPPLAYALASLAAGSRIRDRKHWITDVVSGAGIGMVSAVVVRRWHDAHPRSRLDRVFLSR